MPDCQVGVVRGVRRHQAGKAPRLRLPRGLSVRITFLPSGHGGGPVLTLPLLTVAGRARGFLCLLMESQRVDLEPDDTGADVRG